MSNTIIKEEGKKPSFGKKFLDWVNADAGLPTIEQLEEERAHAHHDHHGSHEHHEEHEADELGLSPVDRDLVFRVDWTRRVFECVFALAVIAVLVLTAYELPTFGSALNPAVNTVYERYVGQGIKDTGAVNLVAAMILDYRAFDTLGEAFVLFTALVSVIMLIRATGEEGETSLSSLKPEHSLILQYVVKVIVPFVLVLGIYVVLNGHISPGGGFAGGAIIGAGISLYALAFGVNEVRKFFSFKTFSLCASVALLFYCLAKGYSFFMGAQGLETGIPLGKPGSLLSGGLILPLNICVGIVVACTIYGLYALFSEGEV